MALMDILKERFEKNMPRHKNVKFDDIKEKLNKVIDKIAWMEETGGEPDIIEFDDGRIALFDFSKESPIARRSYCYDEDARLKRKNNVPNSSVFAELNKIGLNLIDEKDYRFIQKIEPFDLKTSSWILTPESIRNLKGALFMERRYNEVFLFHNGADSYYGSRGFRTLLVL